MSIKYFSDSNSQCTGLNGEPLSTEPFEKPVDFNCNYQFSTGRFDVFI